MKLRQLLYICSDMLSLDYSEAAFGENRTPDATQQKLINCFNIAYDQMYRECALCLRRTVVVSHGGEIDLTPYKLNKVISLVDAEGNGVPFRYGENCLYVEWDGEYNMCYARLPDEVGWNDDVVMPSPVYAERLLAYAIAREYLTTLNDWQGAAAWDERFRDGCAAASSRTGHIRLPQRRWL